MAEQEWLAEQFEEQRPRLRAVAYRMLGSLSEADDAVQDAWIRLSRADTSEVENLGAWLRSSVLGGDVPGHAFDRTTGVVDAGSDRGGEQRGGAKRGDSGGYRG